MDSVLTTYDRSRTGEENQRVRKVQQGEPYAAVFGKIFSNGHQAIHIYRDNPIQRLDITSGCSRRHDPEFCEHGKDQL